VHSEWTARSLAAKVMSSDFTQKVGETLGTRGLLMLSGLAASVLMARALGPDGRGVVAAAAALTAVGMQIANVGLPASNVYYVARDPSLMPALIGNSLAVGLLGSGLGCLIAAAFLAVFSASAPVSGTTLAIALAGIPLGTTLLLLQNLLLGVQRIHALNAVEVGTRLFSLAAIVLLIALGATTPNLVLAASLAATAVGGCWTLFLLRARRSSWTVSFELLRTHMGFGLKAFLANLFAFMLLRIDVLMVQDLRGSADTGFYSIAVSMADVLYVLPMVVGMILFPRLSGMGDPLMQWRATRRVAWVTAGILVVAAVTAGIVAHPFVSVLYGNEFLPAVPAFLLLLPGIVTLGTYTVVSRFYASTGLPWFAVYAPGVCAGINILLNLVLIPKVGINGASIASSVCYTLMLAVSLGYLLFNKRKLGLVTQTEGL
jgi:O-antigen/teichoic acid export membrane protein